MHGFEQFVWQVIKTSFQSLSYVDTSPTPLPYIRTTMVCNILLDSRYQTNNLCQPSTLKFEACNQTIWFGQDDSSRVGDTPSKVESIYLVLGMQNARSPSPTKRVSVFCGTLQVFIQKKQQIKWLPPNPVPYSILTLLTHKKLWVMMMMMNPYGKLRESVLLGNGAWQSTGMWSPGRKMEACRILLYFP